jgi:hypothetical protein
MSGSQFQTRIEEDNENDVVTATTKTKDANKPLSHNAAVKSLWLSET